MLSPPLGGERACHRSGATLLEVLVAIFIMGIGLIALLVLFPLGALTMAQAIRNERAAHAALAASSIANVKNIRRDSAIYDPTNLAGDYFYQPKPGLQQTDPEKRSFPVLVDPVGYFTAAGLTSQDSVGGIPLANTNFLLRRRPVSFTPAAGVEVYKWFTFQDDIIFDKAGSAKVTGPGPLIERDVRFSIAYLMQRPRTADPSVVDCQVVVYDSRPLGLAGNLDLSETPWFLFDVGTNTSEVTFFPASNGIRIWYGAPFDAAPYNKSGAPPPIRSGDWVLDVSVVAGEPHGYFYKVAGVTDSGTYLDLETQQPLRGFGAAASVGTNAGARLLFLEGVAEVFDRNLGPRTSQ